MAALARAPGELYSLFSFIALFLFVFAQTALGIIQYDRQTLLNIRSSLRTDFNTDSRSDARGCPLATPLPLSLPTRAGGRSRRKRKRGRRTGILCRTRRRSFSPPLPRILLAKVQSLENKVDELNARIRFQRDVQSCSPRQHQTASHRPAPPPTARTGLWTPEDKSRALEVLYETINGLENVHPEAAFILVEDFNRANLKKVLPKYYQHIKFPTRGEQTLDHCYTTVKDSYKPLPRPAFCKADHTSVLLLLLCESSHFKTVLNPQTG
ncbi:hypothetical protein MHYP_G00263820 [Metynnis hypsauchen]